MILDITDDGGAYMDSILRAAPGEEVPDFLKSASYKSSIVVGASPFDEDYALVVMTDRGKVRKYPLMTKGAAATSVGYFTRFGAGTLPASVARNTAANLVSALEGYGLPVEGIVSTMAKEASGQQELVYVASMDDLVHPTTPGLRDLFGSVEDSIDDEVLSPGGRHQLWSSVKEAGEAMTGLGEQYARDVVGSDLRLCMDARKTCLSDRVAKDALDEIVKMASDHSVEDLADVIYRFDVDNGIQHLWGKYFPDPYLSVVGDSISKTAAEDSYVSVSGTNVRVSDFSDDVNRAIDDIRGSFGDDMAKELKNDPAGVYNSLPVDVKSAIGNMLNR